MTDWTPKKTFYGYYICFDATGVEAIDAILESLAAAGKGYHHTEEWTEAGYTERIYKAADAAANRIRELESSLQAMETSLKSQIEISNTLRRELQIVEEKLVIELRQTEAFSQQHAQLLSATIQQKEQLQAMETKLREAEQLSKHLGHLLELSRQGVLRQREELDQLETRAQQAEQECDGLTKQKAEFFAEFERLRTRAQQAEQALQELKAIGKRNGFAAITYFFEQLEKAEGRVDTNSSTE